MGHIVKELNEQKNFVKKNCEVFETKILNELEKYSLQPVRGVASPFLASLKQIVKKQVEEEIESELTAMNQDPADISNDGSV